MAWTDNLPAVRGKLLLNEPLGPYTWFRVGGAADALFIPADADDLADFLKTLPEDVPVTAIGVGSTRSVTAEDRTRLDELLLCPALFQHRVPGSTIRIHIVGDHVVVPLHGPVIGSQHDTGRVTEVFTGAQPRLLADHPVPIDMLDTAIGIGDAPVACDQACGDPPLVVDADRVGEHVTVVVRLGFLVEELRRDLDFQRVVRSLVHAHSVSPAAAKSG